MRWSLLLVLSAACASPATQGEASPREEPPPLVGPPPAGTIHRTSREAGFRDMMEELARADVVYLGESHDDAAHHGIQARVLEELLARGRLHAIGMEMFQRPFQRHLDDFVEGRTTEEEMLERTEWKTRWGFDPALYRPILEFARRNRVPIVALNAPDEARKALREGGRDAIPEALRRDLPAPYTDDPEHRAFLLESFRAHRKEGEEPDMGEFERFYLAMCLWDDTMADSIVRWFLTAPKGAQMAVIAGGGHLANRYGIPARAHRRDGRSYAILMPVSGEPEAASFAARYADFVWVTK